MSSFYRKLPLTLFLGLIVFISYSQGQFEQGFITTMNNRIMSGYIQILDPVIAAQVCRFKETLDSEILVYRPDELLKYNLLNGKTFYSAEIENEIGIQNAFIEVIVDGNLKLFGFFNRYFVSNEYDSLEELTEYNFIDLLTQRFNGCEYMVTRTRKISFSRNGLHWAIEEYNMCIESGPETFVGSKATADFIFTLSIEGSRVIFDKSIYNPILSDRSIKNKSPLAIGFDFILRAPKVSNKFRLGVAMRYSIKNYEEVSNIYATKSQMKIKFSELMIPLFLRYNIFQKEDVSFYFQSGISLSKSFKMTSNEIRDTNTNSGTTHEEFTPFKSITKKSQGFFGFGINFRAFEKRRFCADFTYFAGNGSFGLTPSNIVAPTKPGHIGSRFKNNLITLGYFF